MEFGDVVKSRRSVRNYDSSRKISDSQLKELFELVKLSPSSYNLQPWEFVVVRDAANKKRLRACAKNQRHVEEASAVVIVLGSTDPKPRADGIAADRMKKGLMDDAKRASFFASVKRLSEDKEMARLWTVKSTSLAAMTLMLAAKSMGIDSCPLESFDAECIKREFNVPDSYEVVMLIALGWQSQQPPERPMRFGYSDIVHLERFGNKAEN